jgi:hypothetical protein
MWKEEDVIEFVVLSRNVPEGIVNIVRLLTEGPAAHPTVAFGSLAVISRNRSILSAQIVKSQWHCLKGAGITQSVGPGAGTGWAFQGSELESL